MKDLCITKESEKEIKVTTTIPEKVVSECYSLEHIDSQIAQLNSKITQYQEKIDK
jgi:hypothetical protein